MVVRFGIVYVFLYMSMFIIIILTHCGTLALFYSVSKVFRPLACLLLY